MRITCFFYYGCILPLAEITSLMVQYGQNDPYCFILDQGLQYRRVGEVNKAYRIVVGKELDIMLDSNPYNLDTERLYLKMDNRDIERYKISRKETLAIANKLLLIGCYAIPDYYATYNFVR